jgi:hypothetical protein
MVMRRAVTAPNAKSDNMGIEANPNTSISTSAHETPWLQGAALSGMTPACNSM